jgi:hypothetical protein
VDNLRQFKIDLKQSLPQKGITHVLKALKEALPESSPAYNLLIQLESEYREHKLKVIEGILDSDEIQRAANFIRKRLLELIDSLKEEDFSEETPSSLHEPDQRVRRGHVLYQIPKTMQLGEESRCLVRIAFDKVMLVEDLDLDEKTEVRADVRISDYMKVEIVDPAAPPVFTIRTQSEPVQFIDKDDFTEWRFYVKPLQPGEHVLALKVTIIMVINGREVPRERTLEENVVIIAEAVEEPASAFQQLGETFEIGGGIEPVEPPMVAPEAIPPSPRMPTPRAGGETTAQKEAGDPVPQPAPPPRQEPAPRRTKRWNATALSLLILIAVSTAAYAFVPPAEIAWVTTRYLKNSPEAYDSFIAEYGDRNPLRREQAYFRRAAVSDRLDAYRAYLSEYEAGRFAEEATWQVARLSDEPAAYDRYIREFPRGAQLAEAKEALQRLEPQLWAKLAEQRDTASINLYLDIYPDGQFREKVILLKNERQQEFRIEMPQITIPDRIPQIAVPDRIQLSDDEVWENIRGESKAADLRKYLELFPEGKHVREARRRLSILERGLKLDLDRALEVDTLGRGNQ